MTNKTVIYGNWHFGVDEEAKATSNFPRTFRAASSALGIKYHPLIWDMNKNQTGRQVLFALSPEHCTAFESCAVHQTDALGLILELGEFLFLCNGERIDDTGCYYPRKVTAADFTRGLLNCTGEYRRLVLLTNRTTEIYFGGMFPELRKIVGGHHETISAVASELNCESLDIFKALRLTQFVHLPRFPFTDYPSYDLAALAALDFLVSPLSNPSSTPS